MAQREEIDAITGLRGVAAAMVAISHLVMPAAPFAWQTIPIWFMVGTSLAPYGMTLFFTLSGFVITYNYFYQQWHAAPIRSALTFGWHRFSRLYPLLLLFIIIHADWQHFNWITATQIIPIATWVPIKSGGVLAMSGPFNVSWSIGTEFALYIAFTAAMIIGVRLHKRGRLFYLFLAFFAYAGFIVALMAYPGFFAAFTSKLSAFEPFTSLLPSAFEPLNTEDWRAFILYQGPYYRVLEFAIGGVAGWLVLKDHPALSRPEIVYGLPTAALALLIASQWRYLFWWPFNTEGTELFSSFLFASIMLAGRKGPVARALSPKLIVGLGTISYALYLFHQSSWGISGVFPGTEAFAISLLPRLAFRLGLVILVASAMAYGLYWLYELPAKRLLRTLGRCIGLGGSQEAKA